MQERWRERARVAWRRRAGSVQRHAERPARAFEHGRQACCGRQRAREGVRAGALARVAAQERVMASVLCLRIEDEGAKMLC